MRNLLLVLLLCPLFFFGVRAEAFSDALDALGDTQVFEEGLREEERAISGKLRLDGGYDLEGALQRLWTSVLNKGKAALSAEVRLGLRLFLLSLLCALGAVCCDNAAIREAIDRIGCCGAVLLVSGGFSGLLDEAGETVRRLCDYALAILPTLFTVSAMSGAAISAPVRYAAACLVIDVLMNAAQRLILPLIYAYYALSVSLSLYPNPVMETAAKLCKWCVITSMTALTLSFGTYLSLSGLIAGSADAVAVKTTKTVISRSLPIVGGILSDSAGVLLSAAGMIRSSLGAFALVAVSALCVGPVVLYGLRLLIFKAAATASALFPGARLPGLIDTFGTVFGMLLGLIGCCASMLFVAIVSGMKAVGAG